MKLMLSRFVGTALMGLFLTLAVAGGAEAQVPSISGDWVFTVTTDTGTTTPAVSFVHTGNELKGNYSSETLGASEFTGTVDGNRFTFTFSADPGLGQAVPVVYSGTIESATALTGTLDIGPGMVGGTFTAAPKPMD
jgi:hypothetical protein